MFALRYQSKLLRLCAPLSTRKSYEFEDLLQSSAESSQVNWYHQSRLGLTRTLSEENVYEDIIGKYYIPKIISVTFCLARKFINWHKVCKKVFCDDASRPLSWISHTSMCYRVHWQSWQRGQNLFTLFIFFCNLELCRSAFIKNYK